MCMYPCFARIACTWLWLEMINWRFTPSFDENVCGWMRCSGRKNMPLWAASKRITLFDDLPWSTVVSNSEPCSRNSPKRALNDKRLSCFITEYVLVPLSWSAWSCSTWDKRQSCNPSFVPSEYGPYFCVALSQFGSNVTTKTDWKMTPRDLFYVQLSESFASLHKR